MWKPRLNSSHSSCKREWEKVKKKKWLKNNLKNFLRNGIAWANAVGSVNYQTKSRLRAHNALSHPLFTNAQFNSISVLLLFFFFSVLSSSVSSLSSSFHSIDCSPYLSSQSLFMYHCPSDIDYFVHTFQCHAFIALIFLCSLLFIASFDHSLVLFLSLVFIFWLIIRAFFQPGSRLT